MMTAKFKSLMYREWRVSRKGNIIRACLLLGWVILIIAATTTGISNTDDLTNMDAESGEALNFVRVSALYTGFIAFACAFAMEDVFTADLNSGWLRYSYTLPITPFERALARSVRRNVCGVIALVISFVTGIAICAVGNAEYKLEYAVFNFIMWDVGVILSMFELPKLAGRSTDDIKQINKKMILPNIIFYGSIIIGLLIKYDFDINRLAMDIINIKTPEPGVGTLIIALILMVVLTLADFYLSYLLLRKAYYSDNRAKKSERRTVEADIIRSEISESHFMTGLLYKEFTQNRFGLLITALTPFICSLLFIAMHIFATVAIDEGFDDEGLIPMNFMTIIMALFVVSNYIANIFKGDDKKLWAYFVTSSPDGIKGFLYNKFLLIFASSGLFTASLFFEQTFIQTYFKLVWDETVKANIGFAVASFFILLFLNAVDIPFMIRFGSKRGGTIKLTLMMLVATAGVIGFGFLPEKAGMWLMDTAKSLYNGKADGTVMLVVSVMPYLALGAFLLSYKISCKLFMKGVAEYDK